LPVGPMPGVLLQSNQLSVASLFTNPSEAIGDYGFGGLASFLARARGQSKMSWDTRLVGTNVAAHFRFNFSSPGTPVPVPPVPVDSAFTAAQIASLVAAARAI